MEIEYSNRNMEKVCTNASAAIKKYGKEMAIRIHQRVDEICATNTVEDMIRFSIGRCHGLSGDRRNQYAVDLVHPYRMIFEKKGTDVQVVSIIEVVDYH